MGPSGTGAGQSWLKLNLGIISGFTWLGFLSLGPALSHTQAAVTSCRGSWSGTGFALTWPCSYLAGVPGVP